MENVQIKENERIDDLQIKDYRIIQKTDGFCFGIDAVLLSDYARVKKKSKGIDLCSGTGIIPILMEGKYPLAYVEGLEYQEEFAKMAERSVKMNGQEEKTICFLDNTVILYLEIINTLIFFNLYILHISILF